MQRILHVILVAWAGSLLTICCLVAPSLFAVLPDRQLAGQVAGYFFRLEAWLGLALGILAFILLVRRVVAWATKFDFGLLIGAVLAPLASELGLRQMMSAARAVGDMRSFGLLHGLSALLFAVACAATLLLVWRLSVPPRSQLS
jgi:hypothetical protein